MIAQKIIRFVAGMTILIAVNIGETSLAARGDALDSPVDSFLSQSDMIKRAQRALQRMGIYKGPVDGRQSRDLQRAVRKYQRRVGKKVTGRITRDLTNHLETQDKIGAMLERLDQVRQSNIEAARKALSLNKETRDLLNRHGIDETADPTRDASSCFNKPEERCLLEEAVESAKAIQKPELRDWAYGEILVSQAKAGLNAEAITTVRRIGDARLILVALRDIARAQAHEGRIEEAREAARIIPNTFKRLEALSAVAEIQVKNKDGDGAHETAAQIIRLTEKLDDPLQRVTLLSQMAVLLSKVGDIDGAERALADAHALSRPSGSMDKMGQGAALRHVASAFAEIGQTGRALSMLDQVAGATDKTAVLVSAATSLANRGLTDDALATAGQIETDRYKSVMLGKIAAKMAQQGEAEKALALVRFALRGTRNIDLPYARSYAIGQLSLSLMEIGLAIGEGALASAVRAAKDIENDRLRAYSLWSIAAAQSEKGKTADMRKTEKLAREATSAIVSSLSRVWMLSDLASESLKKGQTARAAGIFKQGITIAEDIKNSWGRARALAKLAATLHEFKRR